MKRPTDPAVAAAKVGRVIKRRTTAKQRRERREQHRGDDNDDPDNDPNVEADASSVRTFCKRNGIGIPYFYKMKAQGLAPVMMRVGGRVLISKESAAGWRAEREQATAA